MYSKQQQKNVFLCIYSTEIIKIFHSYCCDTLSFLLLFAIMGDIQQHFERNYVIAIVKIWYNIMQLASELSERIYRY